MAGTAQRGGTPKAKSAPRVLTWVVAGLTLTGSVLTPLTDRYSLAGDTSSKSAARDVSSTKKTETIVLPLVERDGFLGVPAKINGKPAIVMIDTGNMSGKTLVSSKFSDGADSVGIELGGRMIKIQATPSEVTRTDAQLDAISVLGNFSHVLLDFKNRKVTLSNTEIAMEGAVIPFKIVKGVMLLDGSASISDTTKNGGVILDTGARSGTAAPSFYLNSIVLKGLPRGDIAINQAERNTFGVYYLAGDSAVLKTGQLAFKFGTGGSKVLSVYNLAPVEQLTSEPIVGVLSSAAFREGQIGIRVRDGGTGEIVVNRGSLELSSK